MRKITRIICDLYQLEICSHPTLSNPPASSWTRATMKNRARLFLQRNVQWIGGLVFQFWGESYKTDWPVKRPTDHPANWRTDQLADRPTTARPAALQLALQLALPAERGSENERKKNGSLDYPIATSAGRNMLPQIMIRESTVIRPFLSHLRNSLTDLNLLHLFFSRRGSPRKRWRCRMRTTSPTRYQSYFLRSYHHALAIQLHLQYIRFANGRTVKNLSFMKNEKFSW